MVFYIIHANMNGLQNESFTVCYHEEEEICFAFIERFIFIYNHILAVLNPLDVVANTQAHFKLTSNICSHIQCVSTTNSFVTTIASNIKCKCLFVEFDSVKYVLNFPSTVLFD